jgi:two-component system, response regulator, stage 0 sporulation protein A
VESDSGEDALEVLEREQPDVVLLDLRLPGIDGWGVLEQLRQSGRLAGLRVVVVTAHGGPEVAGRAKALGCRAVLQKPFSLRELVSTLDEIIRT